MGNSSKKDVKIKYNGIDYYRAPISKVQLSPLIHLHNANLNSFREPPEESKEGTFRTNIHLISLPKKLLIGSRNSINSIITSNGLTSVSKGTKRKEEEEDPNVSYSKTIYLNDCNNNGEYITNVWVKKSDSIKFSLNGQVIGTSKERMNNILKSRNNNNKNISPTRMNFKTQTNINSSSVNTNSNSNINDKTTKHNRSSKEYREENRTHEKVFNGIFTGRIALQKSFDIYDFLIHFNQCEGPLIIKINVPMVKKRDIQPIQNNNIIKLKKTSRSTVQLSTSPTSLSSSLSNQKVVLKIYGGEKIDTFELYNRIGWQQASISTNCNEFYLSSIEEDFMININKLRLKPLGYAQLYIEYDKILTRTFLSKQKKTLFPLKMSQYLNDLIQNYINIFQLQEGTEKIISANQFSLFLNESSLTKFHIITHQYDCDFSNNNNELISHKLILKILQNEQINTILFQSDYKELGLKILNHKDNKQSKLNKAFQQSKVSLFLIIADTPELSQ